MDRLTILLFFKGAHNFSLTQLFAINFIEELDFSGSLSVSLEKIGFMF